MGNVLNQEIGLEIEDAIDNSDKMNEKISKMKNRFKKVKLGLDKRKKSQKPVFTKKAPPVIPVEEPGDMKSSHHQDFSQLKLDLSGKGRETKTKKSLRPTITRRSAADKLILRAAEEDDEVLDLDLL